MAERPISIHAPLAIATLVAIAVFVVGCASFRPANAPLEKFDPTAGYRPELELQQHQLGDIALILAFSGGGTRAAALSYGVLLELRDTLFEVGGESRRLLDEVDTISSVSGGSFTSSYYGLHGDGIFEDFEERFLKRNVERDLLLRMLLPHNWVRMIGPAYDRSELAIDYYDAKIFDKAKFSDLAAAGGPLIQINATDLSGGTSFTFVQSQFDLICSDLSSLHVARAVTASSAVPVAFAPITLKNRAGTCGFTKPEWLDEALATRKEMPRRYHIAKEMTEYLDPDARRYLHLVDGGIADNLGVRGPLDDIIVTGGIWDRLADLRQARPKHIVFVVVDSSTEPDRSFVSLPGAPSLAAMLGSISDTELHRYNFETKELLHESIEHWAEPSSDGGTGAKAQMVDIAEYGIQDADDRAFFNTVPTSLGLEAETVDRVIGIGRQLLRESDEFQQLLAEIGGRRATPAESPSQR